jgi:hypothetical protein
VLNQCSTFASTNKGAADNRYLQGSDTQKYSALVLPSIEQKALTTCSFGGIPAWA